MTIFELFGKARTTGVLTLPGFGVLFLPDIKMNIYKLIICKIYKKCERIENLDTPQNHNYMYIIIMPIRVFRQVIKCVGHNGLKANRNSIFQYGSMKIRR